MIDPARVVAADLRIYYLAVFKAEIECVWVVLVVGSGFPGGALAGVFNNASAFGNELSGVNTATVHTRLANLNSYGSFSSFAFLRHVQEELSRKNEKLENKIKEPGNGRDGKRIFEQ
jgi:hypothetical protein